ncbi:CDP-diacylglycerol--glycerol-3-phosphate 3-phosphatidyltransferase [Mahella australiensis]|uniref:CDP-diacylglycerol--glycerol-3-phosphate 3-phosphatidyltransferase n=1 Tax=Mahella australiensis (strain DSM 15567 / CIP 107919 / 50-1 BON) TaxID=697281 RepID=F4A298_MAHA5|nr:CDP-diacylglycerol--glycerol-3-phosphate 3-phosphatidyltransferase [Mahella australiensis]AEE96145.1 CDP-diacylglycerol--glycerol-3-phosphate 3-phosphatidyltransferase [Mahella australiensis 50-1 BON]
MNLANKVTLARIVLIPVFIIFLILPIKYGNYISAVIFTIAALTDVLDGYIARSMKETSALGKVLDPLADKLLVTAALLVLVEQGIISSIPVIIILSREFLITGFRSIAAANGKIIAASSWGKVKTVVQDIAIIMLIWGDYLFGIYIASLAMWVFWSAVALTIISGIDYIYKNKGMFI